MICRDFHCHNGGICQAVKSNKKQQYHPKCICPKHRAGLSCERPNLCLDYCLNNGRCVSTVDGTVDCICPAGLAGPRCERKVQKYAGEAGDTDNEVSDTIVTVLITLAAILGVVLFISGLLYFYRSSRLGAAFKHRRMAENLLASNNIEFANQMYMPEEDEDAEDSSDIIIMRETNNFSNPVYDSLFGSASAASSNSTAVIHEQDSCDKSAEVAGANNESQDLLSAQEKNQNNQTCDHPLLLGGGEESDQDPESVDLLTEKHRGNINL